MIQKTTTGSSSPDAKKPDESKKVDPQKLFEERLKALSENSADDDNDGYAVAKIKKTVFRRARAFRTRKVDFNKNGHARYKYEPIGETISTLALIGMAQLEAKHSSQPET